MQKNTPRFLTYSGCRPFLLLSLFFAVIGSTRAQQPLNMDFEKISAKNPRQPWGWESGYPVEGLETGLDSTIAHGGRYSLLLRGRPGATTMAEQSLFLYMEPLLLTGKTIKLEVWARSETFNGSLLIKLEYDAGLRENELLIKADSVQPVLTGTRYWKKFVFTADLPKRVNWMRISINHSGTGKVWLDDMALWVSNKKIKELPAAAPFTRQQKHWLDSATASIKSVDATPMDEEPSYNDLARFKEMAADCRIIALGEATHGTSEFFRIKHRILEYAVKEMGVRVFAIEDHQLVVEKVNRYVMGDTGTARQSMAGMFGVWDNQEVYNLIKWVKHYNEQHPDDKVEFTGFDMQAVKQPIDSLYRFLKTMDTSLYSSVSGLLNGLEKNWPTIYSASDSIKQVWSNQAQQALEIVAAKKQQWLAAAGNRQDSLRIEWGIQYARLVKQYARENIDPMALYRDEAMAENISWMLSVRKPGTKILLWAHDVHISRGEHPQKELNYHGAISMGSWLAKKYGAQYKAFGISTYSGTYRAFPSYTDYSKWISCPAFPGPVGSLDQALHAIAVQRKVPALLLDLRNARQLKWLSAAVPVRFANHVCYEYSYWTRFSLPYQFDGVIFIDETSAAKRITE